MFIHYHVPLYVLELDILHTFALVLHGTTESEWCTVTYLAYETCKIRRSDRRSLQR